MSNERRRCQYCKREDLVYSRGVYALVKYGVRHYAHPTCLASACGTKTGRNMIPEHQRDSYDAALKKRNDWGVGLGDIADGRPPKNDAARDARDRMRIAGLSKAERAAELERVTAEHQAKAAADGTLRAYAVIGHHAVDINRSELMRELKDPTVIARSLGAGHAIKRDTLSDDLMAQATGKRPGEHLPGGGRVVHDVAPSRDALRDQLDEIERVISIEDPQLVTTTKDEDGWKLTSSRLIGRHEAQDEARAVQCPVTYCGAPIGEGCTTATGRPTSIHPSRKALARTQPRTWAAWEMFKGRCLVSSDDPIRILANACALVSVVPDDAGIVVAVGRGHAPHQVDRLSDLTDAGWTCYSVHEREFDNGHREPAIPRLLVEDVLK